MTEVWQGCYEDRWNGLIVPGAMAHPAKMSRSLIVKIFDRLIEDGVLKPGDTVVDPFGGVGTTGIEAASRGMHAISCELELKFFQLALENYAMHDETWKSMNRPRPLIVNGDSRRLIRNIAHASNPDLIITDDPAWYNGGFEEIGADAIISSPPYEEIAAGAGGLNSKPPKHAGQQGGRAAGPSQTTDQRYGSSKGQLAKLPKGSVDAVVSSPPFQSSLMRAGEWNKSIDPLKSDKFAQNRSPEYVERMRATEGYGKTEGQLAAMPEGSVDAVVSSPPFTQGYSGGGGINKRGYNPDGGEGADKVGDRSYQGTGAERTEGNLELLPLEAKEGETFWHAAFDIVNECYALLKPGGMSVWVVKAFVKNKKIVDFPGDWKTLCEHAGFKLALEVHASLVETWTEHTLFDGPQEKRRERKSFFRRLAEKKGSPRIDHEVVLFMRKP